MDFIGFFLFDLSFAGRPPSNSLHNGTDELAYRSKVTYALIGLYGTPHFFSIGISDAPKRSAIDALLRSVHRLHMTQLGSAEITAAAARIEGHIRHTPVLQVEPDAIDLPYPVWLKLEHTQVTGSFKVRGAFNNLLSQEVPEAGVVAASGGNHGAAVAYAATKLGHKSVVFVPRAIAKEEKLRRMRHFGAEVILTEGSVADCMTEYSMHAEKTGALSVHPYDTALTLAGQGTVALEMEAQTGGFDTIMVATGGGGLIGGIAAWLGDRVRVVSVETEGTNTLHRSLLEGPDIDVAAHGISAGSLGGPRLGDLSYAIIKEKVTDAIVLPDAAVFDAAKKLWEGTRLVGEPGAATALAALTSGAYKPDKDERIAFLVCGGNAEPHWFLD